MQYAQFDGPAVFFISNFSSKKMGFIKKISNNVFKFKKVFEIFLFSLHQLSLQFIRILLSDVYCKRISIIIKNSN